MLARLIPQIHYTFAKFYCPSNFQLKIDNIASKACPLAHWISVFREHGHLFSTLDPLNLYNKKYEEFVRPTDLGLLYTVSLQKYSYKSSLVNTSKTIEQLEKKLQQTYLSNIGVQFDHISNLQEKQWLYNRFQQIKQESIPNQIKIRLAKTLIEAESLDHFLHKKYVTYKRYSGEGAESTIVALDRLFSLSSAKGYEHIVFGMPHRGRSNLMVNIMNLKARHLIRKIQGLTFTPTDLPNVIDDVTSHIAPSTVKQYGQNKIKITMVNNPSHLQAQNPVSLGKARSKQHIYGKQKVLNLQIHGDAAICAQGIVYQSLCLARTPNFDVNGTIHIITNNQIGYTTRPIDSRPSQYPTDIFKAFDAPIIHVNGDDIEDVNRCVELAAQYQQKYKKDIVIDIVCYRKYGHNEVDEPQFTQPLMYKKIRKNYTPNTIRYAKQLHSQGLVDENFYQKIAKQKAAQFQEEFNQAHKMPSTVLKDYLNPNSTSIKAFTQQWNNMVPSQHGLQQPTSFSKELLSQFCVASTYYPSDFSVHSRIKRLHLQKRIKSLQENSLDWATCEAMALFSLNYEGYNIRMTGQDVERGTFSQRHLNLTDQNTQQTFNPLQFFASQQPGRGVVQILNSALTENAALSYEYGYSTDHPNNFTIWEAQFGDFYNTAQVAIDTYFSNSQSKWMRQNSLVLLLPHGYDGAGPEHSSCRIERFLQLANTEGHLTYRKLKEHEPFRSKLPINEDVFYQSIQEVNFSLANPSKPSNYFHLLRRQMKRNFRKPLVIAAPKTLLRNASCVSKIQQLSDSSFKPIWQYIPLNSESEVLILVSGKYVYDVQNLILEQKVTKTALLSIQQLLPFPQLLLQKLISSSKKDIKVYWVQQQNLNSGAYSYVCNRVQRVLNNLQIAQPLKYVGRRAISATAVGSSQLHKIESKQLMVWVRSLFK